MDIVAAAKTAAKVAKGVEKVARRVNKWIEVDQNTRVRVLKDVVLGTFPDPVVFPDGTERHVGDFTCPDFEIRDRVYRFFATGDRDPICDGSTYCPDRIGSFDTIKMAMGHDGIYQYMSEIAKAWGWAEEDVRWLADNTYGNLGHAEAGRQKNMVMRAFGHVFTNLGYTAVRLLGGVYHKSRRGAVVLAATLLSGCLVPSPVFIPSDEQPEYESYVISPAAGKLPDGGSGSTPEAPAGVSSSSADAADFADFLWPYGGFRGGSAALVSGCEISSLGVKPSGMSYKWVSGGCEALGASSKGDCDHTVACLFVKGADGKWRGGKFDWISTSRTTRDFNNIRGGYHGWPSDAVETARAYAFVIVSSDGRRRSNVITCSK